MECAQTNVPAASDGAVAQLAERRGASRGGGSSNLTLLHYFMNQVTFYLPKKNVERSGCPLRCGVVIIFGNLCRE